MTTYQVTITDGHGRDFECRVYGDCHYDALEAMARKALPSAFAFACAGRESGVARVAWTREDGSGEPETGSLEVCVSR